MEFEDRGAFERWLKEQSQEVCVAIATRAALRVWPNILSLRFWKDTDEARGQQEGLALLTARCCLVSGIASTYPSPKIRSDAANAAASAAFAATNETNAATNTAAFAATNAANAARAVTEATANAKAAYVAAAGSNPFDAVGINAAFSDANLTPAAMLSTPLWHKTGWPDGLAPEEIGPTLLDTDPRFEFFKRWYDGMVRGAPMDWELQRRVALIPQEVWEAGADAVAGAIAEIEAAWEAERQAIEPRWPDFEPRHVTHLFENRIIVSAGVSSLSATIRQEFERFRAETGLNETPEMFAPLEALPRRLDRISDILTKMEQSDATEQALREEIGRLNAQVANLEAELAKAKADCEALQRSSWKTVAAWTIGGANLFGVLATALWTVSGDEVGAQQRLETLVEYRDVLMGTGQPPIGP
ncbi:MAG: hypothetical protein CMF72_13960 [Mameliella sp.]|nr:hypothetical protein [Mameliella sp.]|tara:strand:- start:2134 stop:3381 length:1248 start_codon:yes stop_codon:yes gene_type:complete